MSLTITHNPEAFRFEYTESGLLCRIDYVINEPILTVTHTLVPPALGGKGIAAELTEAVFAYAKKNGWKVRPVCSYTATYFKRHPEHQALLAL